MTSRALLCTAVLVLCLGSASQSPTSAQQVFYDAFDGTSLDASKWTLEIGTGSLTVAGGEATLSCPGGEFPSLTTKANPVPFDGDFVVTVGLRYPSVTNLGVGVVALGADGDAGFWAWQDAGRFNRLVAAVGDMAFVPVSSSVTTAPHVFEWTYTGGIYTLRVDGVLVASDVSALRPTGFGLGHPHPVNFPGPWTTLAVDFISVELVQPTGAVPADKAQQLAFSISPNPARQVVTLKFRLAGAADVNLGIYDARGRRVRTVASGRLGAGIHTKMWDGKTQAGAPAPSGVYFARLESSEANSVRRLVRIR